MLSAILHIYGNLLFNNLEYGTPCPTFDQFIDRALDPVRSVSSGEIYVDNPAPFIYVLTTYPDLLKVLLRKEIHTIVESFIDGHRNERQFTAMYLKQNNVAMVHDYFISASWVFAYRTISQYPWFKQNEQFRNMAISIITHRANPSSLASPIITSENLVELSAVTPSCEIPNRIHTLFTLTY